MTWLYILVTVSWFEGKPTFLMMTEQQCRAIVSNNTGLYRGQRLETCLSPDGQWFPAEIGANK